MAVKLGKQPSTPIESKKDKEKEGAVSCNKLLFTVLEIKDHYVDIHSLDLILNTHNRPILIY